MNWSMQGSPFIAEPETIEFQGHKFHSRPSALQENMFVQDLFYREDDEAGENAANGLDNCYYLLPAEIYAKQLISVALFKSRFDQQKQREFGPKPMLTAHGHHTGFMMLEIRTPIVLKLKQETNTLEVTNATSTTSTSTTTEKKRKQKSAKKLETSISSTTIAFPSSSKELLVWKSAMIGLVEEIKDSPVGGLNQMFQFQEYVSLLENECKRLLDLPKKNRNVDHLRMLVDQVDEFCISCNVEKVSKLLVNK